MEILIVPPAGVNLQAFLDGGRKLGQTTVVRGMTVPSEIRNDLLQPVFITNDHTVIVDEILRDFSLALFYRSRKSAPSDLLAFQGQV